MTSASDEQIRSATNGKTAAKIEKELQMFEKPLDVIRHKRNFLARASTHIVHKLPDL